MPFGAAYHASAELAGSLRSFRPMIDVQSFGGDGGGGDGEMVLAVHVVACLGGLSTLWTPTLGLNEQILSFDFQKQQPSRFKASHAASQAAAFAHSSLLPSPSSQLLVSVVVPGGLFPVHFFSGVSVPQVPRAAAAGGLGGGGTGGGESNRGSHESPSHTQHTSHHLRRPGSFEWCSPLQ